MLSNYAPMPLEHAGGGIQRIEPRVEGVLKDPHGIRAVDCRTMTVNGVSVAAIDIEPYPGRAWHDLSSDRSTLLIVLDEKGGSCDTRVHLQSPASRRVETRYISYIPAGMRVWGYTDHLQSARTAVLRFDFSAVTTAVGEDIDAAKVETPTLMFTDERISTVGELLAAECARPDRFSQLYGESLITALFTDLLRLRKRPESRSAHGPLAPWQLRRATEYMEEHLSAPISLATLAELTGLSQSRFGRAFKASTGVPPHQWLLRARIRGAQQLLLTNDLPVTHVALAAGFSE
jgi:AraC family transcriptional regulator